MRWQATLSATVGDLHIDVDLRGDDTPLAIVGPNGAGKTSLLRLIAGAYRPQAGRIVIHERALFDSEAGIDLPPEARGVGYVPQGYGLFPHLRAVDNVAFGLCTPGRRETRSQRHRAALAMLKELDAEHLATRYPGQLSGGEQQRVALARALILEPPILLLDEPLAAMDASARRALRGLLAARLRARQRPCIVVTHDLRDVMALGAHVYVMEQGRVTQQGAPQELARAPASDFVAELCDSVDVSQG